VTGLSVVLLGASGQLGRTIAVDWHAPGINPAGTKANAGSGHPSLPGSLDEAADDGTAIDLHGFGRADLDIGETDQLNEKLSSLRPRVIVNAAAYTKVDLAETETEQAFRVNRDGAANLAHWAADNHCRLIHLSTDFVFTGNAFRAYRPDDTAAPVNSYGKSKLAGEQAVRKICPEGSIIVRTGWLYSRYQPNFVTTMLRLMKEKRDLRVVVDQLGTPTSTHSLARLLATVATSDVDSGVYHWSDAGVASWYDFAVAVQEEALATGLLENAVSIEPIASSDYPTPAARPAFSVLDKTLAYQHFNQRPVHWRQELRRVIAELAERE